MSEKQYMLTDFDNDVEMLEKINEQQEHITHLEDTNDNFRIKLIEDIEAMEQAEKKIDEQQVTISALKEENEQLKKEYKIVVDEMVTDYKKLEKENEQLRKQVKSSETTSNATSNYNAFLESKITTLEKENRELNSIKKFAERNGINIFLIDEAFRKCWKDNGKLFEENEKLDKENKKLQEEIEELKRESDDWKSSTCSYMNKDSILSMDCQIVREALWELEKEIEFGSKMEDLFFDLKEKFEKLNNHRIGVL